MRLDTVWTVADADEAADDDDGRPLPWFSTMMHLIRGAETRLATDGDASAATCATFAEARADAEARLRKRDGAT